MKKIIVIILLGLLICISPYFYYNFKSLKEGDIVYQISKSKQSPYIIFGTLSPWSHCGIIIEKENKLYVLEASNVVKLTPYKEWKKKGVLGIIKSKRIFNNPIHINYKKYIGISYDKEFKLNNNKYYCSELVYDIYKNQLNYYFKLYPISKYNINNGIAKKFIKKRNINKEQLFIAPCDLK